MQKLKSYFPSYTRDEATELCVHHLRLAAAFYQMTPEDNNASLLSEIKRQCDGDEFSEKPAKEWAAKILKMYERLKKYD